MANRADEIKKVKEMIKDKKVLLLGGLMAMSPLAANGQSLPAAEAQPAPITQTSGEYENAINEIKEAAPMVCRDGFKNFKSLLLEENISGGASVITAREDVKSYQNIVYPKKQTAELSLDDYRSVCVYANVQNMTSQLVDLCAQNHKKDADKIFPEFSKKYADKIAFAGKGSPIQIDAAAAAAIQQDVMDNFGKLFPDFNQQTSEQYKVNRNELQMTSVKQLSDAQYHMITEGDGYYHIPNAQNKQAASKTRIKYDNVVKKLNNQQQITSKTISWMQAQKLSR